MCTRACALLLSFAGTSAFAQDVLDEKRPIFARQDVPLGARLRELTLFDAIPGGGKEIVVLERLGNYPDWTTRLAVFSTANRKALPAFTVPMPTDGIFYSFVQSPQGAVALAILRPRSVEFRFPDAAGSWEHPTVRSHRLERGYEVSQPGAPQPAEFAIQAKDARIYVPTVDGVVAFEWSGRELREGARTALRPKAYYFSSTESQPLELPFWVRGTLWYPRMLPGSLDGAQRALLLPWMDEVEILGADGKSRMVYFKRISDAEREDGQSHVILTPVDLDADGRTDFVLNKFKGAATSLSAETTVHRTRADGQIDLKGEKLQPQGNRAAGAIPVDVNRDGKLDLAVASSQFNAWAIARALTQGQVKVQFAFYYHHADGYRMAQADFTREILFGFDLGDLDIEGLLPSLEGDFNGDGYPDVFYARDRKSVTVLVQHPRQPEIFAAVPSGEFEVTVQRKVRIGDLDGDGKSDVVLYDRRAQTNRKFTVLLSTGALR